mmetsp:Transcript_4382/g.6313  ORF Transcript_4382/g.6313 Transcript_4382/m.6313 type:complete len:398 (-) Transcript_4382:107-1300(-)
MNKHPHHSHTSSRDKIFPQQLMEILADPSNSDSIAWVPDGKAFIISNKTKFTKRVLPKYFGETKYNSFIRKLNRWNFQRISIRRRVAPIYHHVFFQRDHEALCTQMYCKNERSAYAVSSNTTGSNPEPKASRGLNETALVQHSLQDHTSRALHDQGILSANSFQDPVEAAAFDSHPALRLNPWTGMHQQGRQGISNLSSVQNFQDQEVSDLHQARTFVQQVNIRQQGHQQFSAQEVNDFQLLNDDDKLNQALADQKTNRLLNSSVIGHRPFLQNSVNASLVNEFQINQQNNDVLVEALVNNRERQRNLTARLWNTSMIACGDSRPNLCERAYQSGIRKGTRDIAPMNPNNNRTPRQLLNSSNTDLIPTMAEKAEQQQALNLLSLRLAAMQRKRHSNT